MDIERERLRTHVVELAGEPRPFESEALRKARGYVRGLLEESGWSVADHSFEAETEEGMQLGGTNLVAFHPDYPLRDERPRFCLGAHLDTRPDSPGADDNASAVATLLEIARVLPFLWPGNSQIDLELLVFDLEEVGMLGGAEHARLAQANRIDLRGMVSLEMLGYCNHEAGSQMLPRKLVGLYPDTGDFIALIGNQNSDHLLEVFRSGMERVEELPVESLSVPANGEYLQATRLSDHSPFWDAGYSALMITDTSFLRTPHYHLPSDTPETLDMEFLHTVARGCLQAVCQILAKGL